MPTYDYACEECGHPFEVYVSITEYSRGYKAHCPGCGSERVTREFTSVQVLTSKGGRNTCSQAATCGKSCATCH